MSLLWEKLIRPTAFALDAERAHELGIKALQAGLASPFYSRSNGFKFGPIECFGLKFPNPIGVAAGFDKNGLVFEQLSSLGFGFVEVGTVTLQPQKGNDRPRLFRLPEDQALMNRLGFNNDGAVVVADRLRRRRSKCVIGVNIGKNKNVPNDRAVEDYQACLRIVHPVADYIAVNVSSPNTPELRKLQSSEHLDGLLSTLQVTNRDLGPKPLLLKIAPDLSEPEVETIVDIAIKHGTSGMIATNTTIEREGLKSSNVAALGDGGLSGRPLSNRSNKVISAIYRHTKGKMPIVGVGGLFSAEDAFEKISAGASLVQAYTGFVYGGPAFARKLNAGLEQILEAKGYSTIDEAVGSAVA